MKDRLTNKWFFTELSTFYKNFFFVFIKGDLLILIPLLVLILLTGFISMRLMLLLLGSYIVVRYLGEMIYWLLQQQGDRKYRPGDFGFKKLDNHAIYIIYQTISIFWIMVGLGIIFGALIYLR